MRIPRHLAPLISLILLMTSCSSSVSVEAGFDQTLIEEPTLLVQSQHSEASLNEANVPPGPRHTEFDSEKIDQALQALFEQDNGDDLYILKLSLIPTAVAYALETGDGNPDAMGHTEWLGEINWRIDTALNQTNYEPPTTISEADIERVINAGLASLIAQSLDTEPNPATNTIIIKTVSTYQPVTPIVDNKIQQSWENENLESRVEQYQLLKTLAEAGYIELPPETNPEDAARTGSPRLSTIPIETTEPDTTAEDWREEFSPF